MGEAVVQVWERAQAGKHLVAYLVPSGEEALAVEDVRAAVSERLPEYMLSSFFVLVGTVSL